MPSLNQTNAWSIASLSAPAAAAVKPSATASAAGGGAWDFSFHNLLEIINPLQHLPVIGMLYRALTGDKIGTPEKIAGDTLYGGVWGAVSSIADSAFESLTGKNMGDTVLALFTGHHANSDVAVADNSAPASAAMAMAATAAPTQLPGPDVSALSNALAQKGIDGDTARRAILAYRRSTAATNSLLGAVN